MKRISSILIFISLLSLMQSCIKEDSFMCDNSLKLRFSYTLNKQYINLFDAEVDNLTVYLFNSEGKYVGSYSQAGETLTNDYIMEIGLPKGEYSAVALGGDLSTYKIKDIKNGELKIGESNITDFRIELNHDNLDNNNIYNAHSPNDLYVGTAMKILATTNKTTIYDLKLTKDTKKIKVKIESTNPLSLDVYIVAKNGRFLYNNDIDNTLGSLKYLPLNLQTTQNYTEADLKIMRLTLNQSPMLVIIDKESGEVLYNENIVNQILLTQKYNSQDDFDREDQFVFAVNIESKDRNLALLVSINGWKINNINPN